MKERFEIRPGIYLVKKKGKIISINEGIWGPTDYEVNPEKLKLWLEEATKPRYEVVQLDSEIWSVVNNSSNWIRASFFKEEGFYAKAEAERLCRELNEKDGDR